jgi:hypothetical protein
MALIKKSVPIFDLNRFVPVCSKGFKKLGLKNTRIDLEPVCNATGRLRRCLVNGTLILSNSGLLLWSGSFSPHAKQETVL